MSDTKTAKRVSTQNSKKSKRVKKNRRDRTQNGQYPKVSLQEAQALLKKWRKDPSRPEWVQLKIFYPDFVYCCKPRSEDPTTYKSRWSRVAQLGYMLKHKKSITRWDFMNGYLHLRDSGVPLLGFEDAYRLHATNPKLAFVELIESLAKWDFTNSPPRCKQRDLKNSAKLGKILPTLKELKVRIRLIIEN